MGNTSSNNNLNNNTKKNWLVGPASAYYYPDIEGRKILLLGDIHGSFSFDCGKNSDKKEKELVALFEKIKDVKYKMTDGQKRELIQIVDESIDRKAKNKYLLHEYLYLLGKYSKECVDVYVEDFITRFELPYVLRPILPRYIKKEKMGSLNFIRLLFKLCNKFAPNNNKKFCYDTFRALRYHQSDTRIHTAECVLKIKYTIKKRSNKEYEKILYSYISERLFGIETNQTKYDFTFLDNDDIVTSTISLVKKQFKKSIFFGNEKKIMDIIIELTQYGNLYFMIEPIIITLFAHYTGVVNKYCVFLYELDNILMNLYLIFRMFITKEGWKKGSDKKRVVSDLCKDLYYPKNIVVFTGDAHTRWLVSFIDLYFNVKADFSSHHDGNRCIKFDGWYPFEDLMQ